MAQRVVGRRRCARPRVPGSFLVACVLAAALTVPGSPVVVVGSVARADPQLRVLQFNLCASGLARCYTGRALPKAATVIRAQGPDVVTLNELCQGDTAELERAVADGRPGGVVVSAFQAVVDRRTRSAVHCRDGRPYGIGLIVRLPSPTSGHSGGGGIYPMQDGKRIEQRAWLCLTGDAFTACTTHLVNNSPVVARAQCDYLLHSVIPALPADGPVVLGGDLNLRSSPDVEACLPSADRRADDGDVQHVVTTPGLTITSHRAIAMAGTTDHPALVATLRRAFTLRADAGATIAP